MSFEQLAGDLELLAKSRQQADDEEKMEGDNANDNKIADAAAAGGDSLGEGVGDGDDDEDDEQPLGKSFSVTLPSGEEAEAIDATEMLKSLTEQVEEINGERATENAALTKALNVAHDLLKSQGEEINALKSQVKALAESGRGRKAVLSVADKATTPLEKSQPTGIPAGEVMAKCLAAQKSGRITSMDVCRANIAIESGLAVPPDVVARLAE